MCRSGLNFTTSEAQGLCPAVPADHARAFKDISEENSRKRLVWLDSLSRQAVPDAADTFDRRRRLSVHASALVGRVRASIISSYKNVLAYMVERRQARPKVQEAMKADGSTVAGV